jgi:hypothetical protein
MGPACKHWVGIQVSDWRATPTLLAVLLVAALWRKPVMYRGPGWNCCELEPNELLPGWLCCSACCCGDDCAPPYCDCPNSNCCWWPGVPNMLRWQSAIENARVQTALANRLLLLLVGASDCYASDGRAVFADLSLLAAAFASLRHCQPAPVSL